MSAVHSILWLPESLCDQVAAQLRELVDEWTRAWGLPAAGALEVRPLPADEPQLPTDVIDLLASPSATWRGAISQALFKSRTESPIVEGVVRRMLSRLQEQLRGSFASQLATIDATAPLLRPGHQGVRISLELLGLRCGFFVTAEQLRTAGHLARLTSSPLAAVDYEEALASLPVQLVAELGHASLSVADLLQLAPGDVLVLNEDLAAPLRLVSPGSSLSLMANLGASRETSRRAARWSTPS